MPPRPTDDTPVGFALDLYVLYKVQKVRTAILTVPVVFCARGHSQPIWVFSLLSRWGTILRTPGFIFQPRFGLVDAGTALVQKE